MTEEGSETRLSDCELLLRKYLDNKIAQIDTLFVLAQFFEKHNNNASKFIFITSALIRDYFNQIRKKFKILIFSLGERNLQ